jgi:predicted RNase H-like nuclease
VRFLGVELAWSDGHTSYESGVVAVDEQGVVVDAGWTVGVDATVAWAGQHAIDDAVIFVDAPLVVANETGQRLCEKQVGQRYGRWKVSANSTNLASPRQAGVRLREELEAAGWVYADGAGEKVTGGRTVSECYPYTTLVGADELGTSRSVRSTSVSPRACQKPSGDRCELRTAMF